MKKLFVSGAIQFSALLFSSCEKEPVQQSEHSRLKETLSSKKWKLVSSETILPTGNKPKDIESCRLDNIWEYKKDGTFALYVGEELCRENESTMYGTWELSQDNSEIKYNITGVGAYNDEVLEISSEKMVVSFTADNVYTETFMPL